MSSSLTQGRIVWVELLDPQGRDPKRRPAVILTPTLEIAPDGEIVVAALTSQTDQSSPDVSVELPWHRDGHPRIKLNHRNVIVCTWLATLPVAAIGPGDIGGTVPFAQLARILDTVQSRRTESPPPPPEPPTEPDA